jgi:hypothetical protein
VVLKRLKSFFSCSVVTGDAGPTGSSEHNNVSYLSMPLLLLASCPVLISKSSQRCFHVADMQVPVLDLVKFEVISILLGFAFG